MGNKSDFLKWKLLRACGAAFQATLLTGCTIVQVSTVGGEPRVERHFGFLQITPPPATGSAMVVASHGLGLYANHSSLTVGAWREHSAIFSDASVCRVVIWAEEKSEFESVRRTLMTNGNELNDICVLNGGVK
ncbi:MAG: hypothetical protein ACTHOH_10525 [Lysobacteraceae bacterium]